MEERIQRLNLFRKYFGEVVQQVFPHMGWSYLNLTSDEENKLIAKAGFKLRSEFLKGTKYHYTITKNFIHYTSVSGLLSILREGKIRLYELHSLDDPQELSYSTKRVLAETIDQTQLDKLKRAIFSLSMCEVEEEKENLKDFNTWRLYGSDGYGAGLVLAMEGDNYIEQISKVFYYEHELDDIKKLVNLSDEFMINESLIVENLYESLFARLLAFHKVGIYELENEVRLTQYMGNENYYYQTIQYDLKNNKERRFINKNLLSDFSERDPYELTIKPKK
ncbi:hypothetical protein [Catalinimonas niigatensis]|uniref:hypothetical protein n=1 Tax=Catalinimonas niigatensis TaxID=1397264 RepID=UPI002666F225|nr:hypothetical protein [Catalinimonas niigatensis]WPP49317.1 hypothetical protein PZB72_21855 [Catalinimonas niigatensis]